ncbi:MAG: copper chaperone PCu(A)C [Ancalomicrobiaceae bacterium]|nr:copper chaperone PCu(A)C [Ancalomicrobiaceae bacterium]
MFKRILVAALLTLAGSGLALAHEYKLGNLDIVHPWTRATPAGAKTGGGYLIVINKAATADRLVSAASDVAGKVELHQMAVKDGVMTMQPLPDGVAIPANGKVEFKPGGYHVMFIDLKAPFKKGNKVKVHLTFEKAGATDVDFEVAGVGETAPADPDHMHMN